MDLLTEGGMKLNFLPWIFNQQLADKKSRLDSEVNDGAEGKYLYLSYSKIEKQWSIYTDHSGAFLQ